MIVAFSLVVFAQESTCSASCDSTSACYLDECPEGFYQIAGASYPSGCAAETPHCCCQSDDDNGDDNGHNETGNGGNVSEDNGPCDDSDEDGVCDEDDNCPDNYNTGQSDSDDDGVGDVCDNCYDVHNPSQSDSDEDGWGDACQGNCIDGLDNDGDNLTDGDDPDCKSDHDYESPQHYGEIPEFSNGALIVAFIIATIVFLGVHKYHGIKN